MTVSRMEAARLRRCFDVPLACAELQRVNRSTYFAAADFGVARQFDPYQALPAGEVESAFMLLDRMWATRLGLDPGAASVLISAYRTNRGRYDRCLRRLQGLSLEEQPERICEIGAEMLETLLTPAGEREVKQHYSFASKVFHWHAPEHLPIVDSRARAAINWLQRRCGIFRGRVLASTAEMGGETYCQEYHRWAAFYADLLRALTPQDRQQLLNADRKSLPPRFRLDNTLLRVLDKVFYSRGG